MTYDIESISERIRYLDALFAEDVSLHKKVLFKFKTFLDDSISFNNFNNRRHQGLIELQDKKHYQPSTKI